MALDLKEIPYISLRSYVWNNNLITPIPEEINPSKEVLIRVIKGFEKAQLSSTNSRKLKNEIKLKISEGLTKEIEYFKNPVQERTASLKKEFQEFVNESFKTKDIPMNNDELIRLQDAAKVLTGESPRQSNKLGLSAEDIFNAFGSPNTQEEYIEEEEKSSDEDDFWDEDSSEEEEEDYSDEEQEEDEPENNNITGLNRHDLLSRF